MTTRIFCCFNTTSFLLLLLVCNCFLGQVSCRRTLVTWVNGIATHIQHMNEAQEVISQLFGTPVQYCYNPTSQSHIEDIIGLFGDLTQAGTQKLGRITDEVNALVSHLRQALVMVGKKGCVIHIAHSQGALITYLASKLLTKEEMNQIEVIALGGAATIRKTIQFPFRRCINYYSVNDPLLWVAPAAAQSLRSGRVVTGINAEDEFCFLAPRVGDPVEDHALIGPTYLQALKWEAARFHLEHRSLAYKLFHPMYFTLQTAMVLMQKRLHFLLKLLLRCLLHMSLSVSRWTHTKVTQIVAILRLGVIRPLIFLVLIIWDTIHIWWRGQEQYELVVKEEIDATLSDSQKISSQQQQEKKTPLEASTIN